MRPATLGLVALSLVMGTGAVVGMRSYIASHTQAPPAPDAKAIILFAKTDIPFGAPLTIDNLTAAAWSGETLPAGSVQTAQELLTPEPRYAKTAIAAGEPILVGKLTLPGIKPTLSATLENGNRAVTIKVDDALGVAGLLTPSDYVDVLLTRVAKRPEDGDGSVEILLSGVKVLAINRDAESTDANARKDVKTVTLQVTPAMAQKLALAGSVGTLSLTLRGKGEDGELDRSRLTLTQLFGGDGGRGLFGAARDSFASLAGSMKQAEARTAPTAPAPPPAPEPEQPRVIEIWRGTARSQHVLLPPGETLVADGGAATGRTSETRAAAAFEAGRQSSGQQQATW